MQEIYEKFKEYHIYDLPDDINAEVEVIIGETYAGGYCPGSKYSITYTYNNETRTILLDDGGISKNAPCQRRVYVISDDRA
jgi:hypothetical protein